MTVRELADEVHLQRMAADPLVASFYGVPGYDHLLPDVSAVAEASVADRARDLLARSRQVGAASLADRITLDALRYAASSTVASAEVALIEFSPGPYGDGPAALVLDAARAAPTTQQAADDHLTRARSYAAYLDQCAERLRSGAAAGRTPAELLIDVAVGQVDGWLAEPALGTLGAVEGPTEQFFADLADVLAASTRPALERYREVLGSLRRVARPDDRCGLAHLPGGDEAYERLIRVHTTLPTTAREVHETGIAACAELAARMEELGAGLGLDGLPAVVARMRQVAAAVDPATAMTAARDAVRRAEALAPQWFSPPLPAPCAVEPMDLGMARAGMAPHFTPPSPDGARPGTYWFNTEVAGVGGGWDLEAVAFHEAVPGHHLQIARDQLQTGLPQIQSKSLVTANAEGWGLYAEVLAGEMGLYSSDEQRLGALGVQMMRACRLVVDTGLHALGWPRDRAVRFVLDRVPMPAAFASAEISRYVSIPGQAVAYLTGQRHLLALRADARARLGESFDPRGFHDAVLGHGQVPLAAVTTAVDAWISSALTV